MSSKRAAVNLFLKAADQNQAVEKALKTDDNHKIIQITLTKRVTQSMKSKPRNQTVYAVLRKRCA